MADLANRCFTLLKLVPVGKITTYKALAHALGTKSYRAIGQILKRNPDAPHTPCHRVVASDGSLSGFMGHTRGPEILKKIRLLRSEGITVKNNHIINFPNVYYKFIQE